MPKAFSQRSTFAPPISISQVGYPRFGLGPTGFGLLVLMLRALGLVCWLFGAWGLAVSDSIDAKMSHSASSFKGVISYIGDNYRGY